MVSWRSQIKFTEYLYAYSILNYKLHYTITYFCKYVLYTSDPVEEACSDVVAATALAMSEYGTAEKYLERRSTLPDQQACSSTVGKGPQASEQSSGMVLAQGLCRVNREPEASGCLMIVLREKLTEISRYVAENGHVDLKPSWKATHQI